MIEFITLYLGLILGPQDLEVSVGPEIAAVEVVLDGETVATMNGEPWRIECDFGPRLIPHHLEAVARDQDGRELARTEQWINLPRPRAEAKLSLEGGGTSSGRWARVIWESVDFERPRRVEAFLDGKSIPVEGVDRFPLPDVDPTRIHFLAANVEFSDSVSARAELVFGGIYSDTVATELTSVVLESDRSRAPKPEQLQGALLHRGRPLRVVAVEKPPAEIVIVTDHSSGTFDALQRLLTTRPGRIPAIRAQLPRVIEKNDWVRHAIPPSGAIGQSTDRYDQIPVTGDLKRRRESRFIDILSYIGLSDDRLRLREARVADTVLVSGLVASTGNRRRAVLLLSAFDNLDVSRLHPVIVRDYLDSLTVPLMIWRLPPPEQNDPSAGASWGKSIDVSDWGAFGTAFRRLRELLDSQIVVWVEGRHLQQEISVSPEVRGVRFARSSGADLAAEIRAIQIPSLAPPRPPSNDAAASEGRTPTEDGAIQGMSPHAGPAPLSRRHLTEIDLGRIDLAHRHLPSAESVPLGPVTLLTDRHAPRLWRELERQVRELPLLYSSHYGIEADLAVGPLVALFHSKDGYDAFAAEAGISDLDILGHASPGFAALYAGKRSNREIGDTFAHELTHLLNLRSLGTELPPWLDEGLAGAMSFAVRSAGGSLTLPPLEPRRLRATGGLALAGPLSTLPLLADALETGRLPSFDDLLAADRATMMSSDSGDTLYALSALWVHFLATADPDQSAAFRAYLQRTAAAAQSDRVMTVDVLGLQSEKLEASFRTWLRWLDEELAVLFAE